MLRTKVPGQKQVALRKHLLVALVRDLNERVLTLLVKDLETVYIKAKRKQKEQTSRH